MTNFILDHPFVVVGSFIAAIIALCVALAAYEQHERDYIASHDCDMVERVPGHYSPMIISSGKTTTVTMHYQGPRGRYACTDGTQHWIDVQ